MLAIGSNPFRIYNELGANQTITKVFLSVSVAPTGATAITVDVNVDAASLFAAGNRPTITAGNFTGFSTTFVGGANNWLTGSYLTADIDAVGSTVAGSNLVVHVIHQDA